MRLEYSEHRRRNGRGHWKVTETLMRSGFEHLIALFVLTDCKVTGGFGQSSILSGSW